MRAATESLPALFLGDDPHAVQDALARVAGASSGRVRSPETINRRTGKPERGGLFCARIFGPVDDLRCLCGKLQGPDSAGQTCDRCGVLCGERRLRDERWGHIESPVPLIHPVLVPQVAAALRCSVKDLRAVLHFDASLRDDGSVVRVELPDARGPAAIARHLGARAAELTLTQIPVTPPGWRGTRRDPQDEAYARLINRTNRLHRLLELDAPQIILDNETLMTQQALERLHKAVRAELQARRPSSVAPSTPQAASLLHAVYDDPDDDLARQAYADHLHAAGDLRGEFITRQLAGARRSRPSRIEADLLRRNLDRWLAPLGDAVDPNLVVFRRGFLAVCRTTAGAAARIGDPAWSTVEHLDTDLVDLITHPVMRGLRSLWLRYRTLQALCQRAAELPRIHTLTLQLPRCPPPAAGDVTRCTSLPGLRALTLISRSVRGDDWTWLAGTPMAHPLERLALQLPLERLDALSLPWWVEFLRDHPALDELTITLGTRVLTLALRREDGLPALKASVSRSLLEHVMLGNAELAQSLARALTALDPYTLGPVHVHSAGSWFGDDLESLARTLRAHFGPGVRLPRLS